MTEELRKLAETLRQENARRAESKRVKCAQILKAAAGLGLLKTKLKGATNGA